MSRVVDVWRQISKPVNNDNITVPLPTESVLNHGSVLGLNPNQNQDQDQDQDRFVNHDAKAIEIQLSESIRVQKTKEEEIRNDYASKLNQINLSANEKLSKLDQLWNVFNTSNVLGQNTMHEQEVFNQIKHQLNDLRSKIEQSRNDETKQLEQSQQLELSQYADKCKIENSKLYQQSIVDNMVAKLESPSYEFELGMALGILIHNDNTYWTDDDIGKKSADIQRRYFTKELDATGIHTEKLFNEHLISKAKSVLLQILTNRAIPINDRKQNYSVEPKPGYNGIQLTDTDILHSFNFKRV